MKKSLLILLCFSLFTINSFADVNKNNPSKKSLLDIEKQYSNTVDYTKEDKQKMIQLLNQDSYGEFFSYIKTHPVSSNYYIIFLESLKNEGHIPVYWLMAEYYSTQKDKELETHIWYYTAIIMTTEDANLCTDPTAKYAADKISKKFKNSYDLVNKTPQYIIPAMREVTFFLQNLKQINPPNWVCAYGTSKSITGNNILIDSVYWTETRERILNSFINNYR